VVAMDQVIFQQGSRSRVTVRILADENVPRTNVAWLRGQGQVVLYAAESHTQAPDADLLTSCREGARESLPPWWTDDNIRSRPVTWKLRAVPQDSRCSDSLRSSRPAPSGPIIEREEIQ
jgi:hypothetical protein